MNHTRKIVLNMSSVTTAGRRGGDGGKLLQTLTAANLTKTRTKLAGRRFDDGG